MHLLITAFEPFGGESQNAALLCAKQLSLPAPHRLTIIKVPTVFGRCTEVALEAVRTLHPDAVLCLGQAAGRGAITPERIAINCRDARIPDNAGAQPIDKPIAPDGPDAYFSRLPIRAMTDAIRAAGVPAAISNSAGTFVCNDLMYGLLHALKAEAPHLPCGFIHVPITPAQAAAFDPPLPSLPEQEILTGLNAAIRTLL